MKKSELIETIEEIITEVLSEAGEKTALITTKSGENTAVDFKNPNELNKIKDNTDIESIKTGGGVKIKETEDDEEEVKDDYDKEDEDDKKDAKIINDEPSKSELKKIEKEFGSNKFAKKLSPEEKEKLNKIEAGIKKKLSNPTKDNIAIVKQLINREDVKKLFKDGGKDLKALISDIIG